MEALNVKEPFKYKKQLAAYRSNLRKTIGSRGNSRAEGAVRMLKSEDPYSVSTHTYLHSQIVRPY